MRHIYKLSKEAGYPYDLYMVRMAKCGVYFVKYVSVNEYGWDDAEKKAIKIEQELYEDLSKCKTIDDVVKVYKAWQ